MPTLYKIKRFYSDRFRNNSLYAQTMGMASAIFFESRSTILATIGSSITGSAFCGLLLILQKNSMLTDTNIFRTRMGAFINPLNPEKTGSRFPHPGFTAKE